MLTIKETPEGVNFLVKVVPRASKTQVIGELEGAIKIRIAAPPVDGAANEELIKFLAKLFGVAKGSVVIASGEASRSKRVLITGINAGTVRTILSAKS